MFTTRHLAAIDNLPVNEWIERAKSLGPEEVQREILRQATDAKLQLISILNALHFVVVVICVFACVAIWRIW